MKTPTGEGAEGSGCPQGHRLARPQLSMAKAGHSWSRAAAEQDAAEEGEDPLDARIARTGCLEQHRQLQECMAERQDWRYCQEELRAFGACMARRQQRERGPGPARPPD